MKKGFTLIELVVAIALISILAVSLSANVLNQINKSKAATVQSDLGVLRTAIELFLTEAQDFPDLGGNEDDLSKVVSNGISFGDFLPTNEMPVTPAWSGQYHEDAYKYSGDYTILEENKIVDNPYIYEDGRLTQTKGQGGWYYYYNPRLTKTQIILSEFRGDIYPILNTGAYGTDVDWTKL